MRGALVQMSAVWCATLVAVAALPFRGLNLWTLWHVDATSRYAAWRRGEALGVEAVLDPNGVMPFVPWVASWFDPDPLVGLRLVAAVAAATVAALTFDWARRVAGTSAGVAAVVCLLLVPRFWDAATTPSATIFAAAACLALWRIALVARDDARWAPALWAVAAVAMATTMHAWFVWIPILALATFDFAARTRRGWIGLRPLAAWVFAAPVVGAMLLVGAVGPLRTDTASRLTSLVTVWLTRPPEPVLFAGELYGAIRLPVFAPLTVWAMTIPVAVVVFAALGITLAARGALRAGDRDELLAAMVAALLLPFCLRSTFHGGGDVLIHGLAPLSVAAGVGAAVSAKALRRRWSLLGGRLATVALGLAFVLAAIDARTGIRDPAAWYSGLIGGVSGAVEAGFARQAHAPLPPTLLAEALGQGERCAVAIVTNAWEVRPVLESYARWGLIPGHCAVADLATASHVIAVYDDTLPEFYSVASDLSEFVRDADHLSRREVDGVPLLIAGPLTP